MEKRNTPVLILSLMWLMAALFSAQRLDAQVALGSMTDGSAAVIPGSRAGDSEHDYRGAR